MYFDNRQGNIRKAKREKITNKEEKRNEQREKRREESKKSENV